MKNHKHFLVPVAYFVVLVMAAFISERTGLNFYQSLMILVVLGAAIMRLIAQRPKAPEFAKAYSRAR